MDFEGLLPLLVLVWLLLGWLGRRGRVRSRSGDDGVEVEPDREAARAAEAELRRRRLQEEMERLFGIPVPQEEPPRGPLGRPARVPLPESVEGADEEIEVLEREPEVVSLEAPEGLERERPARGQAEEAAAVVQRRLRAAEERLRARTPADHARFDAEIRAPVPAIPRRPPVLQRIPLQQAVIWREVLGPPKGLRDPSR